jgi:hypothetical protein
MRLRILRILMPSDVGVRSHEVLMITANAAAASPIVIRFKMTACCVRLSSRNSDFVNPSVYVRESRRFKRVIEVTGFAVLHGAHRCTADFRQNVASDLQ